MTEIDRGTFIEQNTGLVGMVVKEFRNRIYSSSHIDMEDLFQIGTIGLIKAYDRFDPEHGTKFSTYAITSIRWEIQIFLRDKLDGVRVGGSTVYNYLNILQSGLINESPGVISTILDIPIQSVESALAYHRCKYIDSLERPIYNNDEGEIYLSEVIGFEVDFDENIELRELKRVIKSFNENTQKVLRMRMEGMNQSEIGERLNLTQPYVSRLINGAKQKLIKGGIIVTENKKRDFKLGKKLAIETDLNGYEIAEKSGVSPVTAYKYIKDYRVTKEKIEEVESRINKEQPPIKTYKLSPEELEKYREGEPVAKAINNKTEAKTNEPKADIRDVVEEINNSPKESTIEDNKLSIEHRLDIPKDIASQEINPADGFMTMTFKLTTEDATS